MHNNLVRAIAGLHEVIVSGLGVDVDPSLRGSPIALSVAAIVKHEYRGSGGCDLANVGVTVGYVPGISVQIERYETGVWRVDQPTMNAEAIGSIEPDIGGS
jgi:hypothetical protein